jgi:hypothetical protein
MVVSFAKSSAPVGAEFFHWSSEMAQATKMGADTATLEKRRRSMSGHSCAKCGEGIAFGDLLSVKVMAMENGRPRSQQLTYHRKCYAV